MGYKINPSYNSFYYYVHECIYMYMQKNLFSFIIEIYIYIYYIFAHVFLNNVPHMTQDTC